jgi:LmbE family N-acetylglucosaminyl deacetylase
VLELLARARRGRRLNVLCLGAHCDDIEIGCGGTLLALQQRTRAVTIHWAVLSGTPRRRLESESAMRQLIAASRRGELRMGDFADGRLPAAYGEVKDYIEALKRELPRPDVIFCHERDDRHQDHRLVNEMVWNTWRDQLVLEYEIPKWDGGLGQPNVYVPVSGRQARRKLRVLQVAYRTQAERDWFTDGTFQAMLRLRGVECRSGSGLAEAFHGRKLLVGF